MAYKKIEVKGSSIQLDQFLKWIGALPSGGAVKPLVAEGRIFRNGTIETARRRKLQDGDTIAIEGIGTWQVCLTEKEENN